MTKIVFLDRNSLSPNARIRELNAVVDWYYYPRSQDNEIIERCKDAEILVLSKVKIDERILQACPNIKHIAVAATGFNVIDVKACEKHGVSVSNIPSYAGTSVAEHVMGYALNLRRQMIQYRQQVINGAWQESEGFCLFDKPVNDLAKSTMGIIGFGELGQTTAKLAHAMGMDVIFSARKTQNSNFATQLSFDDLIARADIISLHCSLNESTENLIDAKALKKMQNHAILINTARGGIVDESALVNAIIAGDIGGAGIDVLVQEPPQNNSPLLTIADRSNVIITPHSAWLSVQAMLKLTNILADNIEAYLHGNPINLVSKI